MGVETELDIGVTRTLILDGVAHGGYAVGRDAGRVVFVRGGIRGRTFGPGIRRAGPRGRFWPPAPWPGVNGSPTGFDPPCPFAPRRTGDRGPTPQRHPPR